MSFVITHAHGGQDRDPPLMDLPALLAELADAGPERPCVSVAHESGWCLSACASGKLVWENLEAAGAARRTDRAARRLAISLMNAVAAGDLAAVEAPAWLPGY